jgi:hypothetical protein
METTSKTLLQKLRDDLQSEEHVLAKLQYTYQLILPVFNYENQGEDLSALDLYDCFFEVGKIDSEVPQSLSDAAISLGELVDAIDYTSNRIEEMKTRIRQMT